MTLVGESMQDEKKKTTETRSSISKHQNFRGRQRNKPSNEDLDGQSLDNQKRMVF